MWLGSWKTRRGVSFSQKIRIVNADGTITTRPVNVDGGYYDREDWANVDASDEDSLAFFNAFEEQLGSSHEGLTTDNEFNEGGGVYFQGIRYVTI